MDLINYKLIVGEDRTFPSHYGFRRTQFPVVSSEIQCTPRTCQSSTVLRQHSGSIWEKEQGMLIRNQASLVCNLLSCSDLVITIGKF